PGMLGTGRIANLLAAQAIGRPYPDKGKTIEVDEAALKQYEGVYRIDGDAVRVLRVAGGRLTSQRTGGQVQALIPVAKDAFLFDEGFSRIEFERGGDDKVAAMRFFPEDEGEGEVVPRTDEAMPSAREEVTLPREALERLVG